MQINVTFILQIINFAISYAVLSRFLLQPFMQRIYQKRTARATLSAILDNKDDQKQQLITSKEERLVTFREQIQATYQKPTVTLIEPPLFEERQLDEASVQAMINSATAFVVEKVPHV